MQAYLRDARARPPRRRASTGHLFVATSFGGAWRPRGGGRAADLLGRLGPVDGARRRARPTRGAEREDGGRPDRLRHRRHDLRRRPGLATARSTTRPRPGSAGAGSATSPASAPSTSSRSAPAAARSSGSTRAGSCASGRRAQAPTPGPACYGRGGDRADGDRRRGRCSAGSTRPTSSADGCRSTPSAARAASSARSPSRSA